MKKTLLLSVVASTMIMAGGDIAPVEPVVEAPVAASAWEFGGQAVVYYQTHDVDGSLFDQDTSAADFGVQLRATNNDVIGGIGAGFALNGLSTLNLENYLVSGVMQATGGHGDDLDGMTDGGWMSEAYLTYGFGNTSIKAGRQTLPKALSPFAFSESWNVFENTFDAVLVVNTDISNTTVVGAWVGGNNVNSMMLSDLTDFNSINNDDGVYMLTVQNKSISDLTLTGTYYYGADFLGSGLLADFTPVPEAARADIDILWGDAQYNATSFNVGVQGGQVSHDAFEDDITAFGAKIGTTFAGINAEFGYSNVNDGGVPLLINSNSHAPMATGMFNIGGTTSALYTTTMADELFTSSVMNYDSDKYVVRGNMDALGGNISALYAYTELVGGDVEVDEFDLAYSTKMTDNLGIAATYAYINADVDAASDFSELDEDMNIVRLIVNYNF